LLEEPVFMKMDLAKFIKFLPVRIIGIKVVRFPPASLQARSIDFPPLLFRSSPLRPTGRLQLGMISIPEMDSVSVDAGDNAHAFGSGIE
jgi:hypothetical protein